MWEAAEEGRAEARCHGLQLVDIEVVARFDLSVDTWQREGGSLRPPSWLYESSLGRQLAWVLQVLPRLPRMSVVMSFAPCCGCRSFPLREVRVYGSESIPPVPQRPVWRELAKLQHP